MLSHLCTDKRSGPHHGHYVCVIKSAGRWIMCDDENIEPIEESDIFRYFGDYPSGAGYVLFYQAADLDMESLGLKVPAKPKKSAAPPKTPPSMFGNVPSGAQANGNGNANGNGYAHAATPVPSSAPLSAIQQSPPTSPPIQPDEISPHSRPEPTVPGALPVPASAPPNSSTFPNKPSGAPAAARMSLPPQANSSSSNGKAAPVLASPIATPMTASSTGTSYTTGTAGTLATANTAGSGGAGAEKASKDKWYSFGSKKDDDRERRDGSDGASRKPSINRQASLGRKPSYNMTQAPGSGQSPGQPSTASPSGGRERQTSGGSYSGGGGLGRKLSGIGGKGLMQRSGSLMKLGLGKKKEEGISEK